MGFDEPVRITLLRTVTSYYKLGIQLLIRKKSSIYNISS
jgi:hypothetical protein